MTREEFKQEFHMYIRDGWYDQYDISLVGSGSVNFHTFQTGF